MKIEKLYTLSGFIEYLKSDKYRQLWNNEFKIPLADPKLINLYFYDHCFSKVDDYNEFLKQSLKKGMFVNDIEEPHLKDECYSGNYNAWKNDYELWQEAEKKVILSELYFENEYLGYAGSLIGGAFKEDIKEFPTTLALLAERTSGELELKNVEL